MAASYSITRVIALWDRLNSSFWFVPTVMVIVAVALSFLFIEVDILRGVDLTDDPSAFYTFGPEGARSILSVIATSMITVASLIFSITMLSLQLASSQFGPRVLDNFMRDRSNQIVLGTFIATFLYCLFVLRSVRGMEGSSFVPHLAVGFGVVLAAASVAVLIYFIHHIATSIRIETLLAKLAYEGCCAVDRLFDERPQQGAGHQMPDGFDADSRQIAADFGGYVQNVGVDALMRIATEHDLVLRIDAPPGQFVTKGVCVITAYPQDRVSDKIEEQLCGAVVIGRDRTPHQDLEFAIHRIVELAQRSLSPGFNDPTTALYCIDRLGEVLGRVDGRSIPSTMQLDRHCQVRLLTETVVLEDVACRAFAAIARYGITDADVVRQLSETLVRVEASFPLAARHALADFREQVLSASRSQSLHGFDRKILSDVQDTDRTES
ncbi:DUF2254 domain-containing protein [Nisaea sp.]|uniref:DUF2254 domain-containing protein n=1 Tax=Nisaea sp. TaxID=2024842 RepID=UPI002B270385|nr:DUF2254 domain-containing protein [Nisaea sp.]